MSFPASEFCPIRIPQSAAAQAHANDIARLVLGQFHRQSAVPIPGGLQQNVVRPGAGTDQRQRWQEHSLNRSTIEPASTIINRRWRDYPIHWSLPNDINNRRAVRPWVKHGITIGLLNERNGRGIHGDDESAHKWWCRRGNHLAIDSARWQNWGNDFPFGGLFNRFGRQ